MFASHEKMEAIRSDGPPRRSRPARALGLQPNSTEQRWPALFVFLGPAASYSSCSEANNAGEYDIPESDSAYRSDLDWDGDGYACEAIEKKPATADFR